MPSDQNKTKNKTFRRNSGSILGDSLKFPELQQTEKAVPEGIEKFVNAADTGENVNVTEIISSKSDVPKDTSSSQEATNEDGANRSRRRKRVIATTPGVPLTQEEFDVLCEVADHLNIPITQVFRQGVATLKRQIEKGLL